MEGPATIAVASGHCSSCHVWALVYGLCNYLDDNGRTLLLHRCRRCRDRHKERLIRQRQANTEALASCPQSLHIVVFEGIERLKPREIVFEGPKPREIEWFKEAIH